MKRLLWVLIVAGCNVETTGPMKTESVNVVTAEPYIWLTRGEIIELPMSGPAFTAMLAEANATWLAPDLSNQDQDNNVQVLAGALVYVRTGTESYRTKVRQACMAAIDTELGGETLALGRELCAYVIAADLVGLTPSEDVTFREWLVRCRTEVLAGRTLISTHEDRPNNWGTHAGASRIAVDMYLGDEVDLARCAEVFHGWLGAREIYAGFSYGELDWQANEVEPVGINPLGAMKLGFDIDGALPEEMRRGGTLQFPPIPTLYPWEALQGAIVQAELLRRAGYDAFEWEDRALRRAVEFLYSIGWPAVGDDEWQVHLINKRCGTEFSETIPASTGKNMGWTDWTHTETTTSIFEPPVTNGPLFEKVWTSEEGLGPQFNAVSCATCHPGGGASEIIVRVEGTGCVSMPNVLREFPEPEVGAGEVRERMSPSLLAAGAIDEITDATIDSIYEANRGIIGYYDGAYRYNTPKRRVLGDGAYGKFGRRAMASNLHAFVRATLDVEMGLDEASDAQVGEIADFVRALGGVSKPGRGHGHRPPPTIPPPDSTGVLCDGEATFVRMGCALCHTPIGSPLIWSDLMLHDMGEADICEGNEVPCGGTCSTNAATAGEFRTEPLLGAGSKGRWWHDGSSPSLTHAIDRHRESPEAYVSWFKWNRVSDEEKACALTFLEELR